MRLLCRKKRKRQLTTQENNKGVDAWADDAYRFALACCADSKSCKDAVQEAFARLWEKRTEVQFEKGKPYLLSMVHNQLVSMLRYQKVRTGTELSAEEVVEPNDSFDLRDAIQKAMATLPTIQRECLRLRDVEGYAYKEIANILNISDQQVQVYIFRARVALKRQLKEFHI